MSHRESSAVQTPIDFSPSHRENSEYPQSCLRKPRHRAGFFVPGIPMRRRTQDRLWLVVFVVALVCWLALLAEWADRIYAPVVAHVEFPYPLIEYREGDRLPVALPVRNLLYPERARYEAEVTL